MSVTQRPSGKPRNASMINIKVNEYCGSAGKESTCNVGDLGSIPGLGRSPGEGNCYSLQYSGLENSMDCIDYGVTKSRTRLSHFHFQRIIAAQDGATYVMAIVQSSCS